MEEERVAPFKLGRKEERLLLLNPESLTRLELLERVAPFEPREEKERVTPFEPMEEKKELEEGEERAVPFEPMEDSKKIFLNESQLRAYQSVKKFLNSDKMDNFLLLGPAGSGKTTVIINAFDKSEYKIAFCAFTNKATQVLCKI